MPDLQPASSPNEEAGNIHPTDSSHRNRRGKRLLFALIVVAISGRLVVPFISTHDWWYDWLNRLFVLFGVVTVIGFITWEIGNLRQSEGERGWTILFIVLAPVLFVTYYRFQILDAFWLR